MNARRNGGAAAVSGGVLALVGNLVHPRYDGENVDIYQKIAASDRYLVADFVLLVALVLLVAAVVSIARHIGSSPLAGHGRLFAVIGGTIAIAQLGLETFALRHQAEIFASAPPGDQSGSFWAANAIDHLNMALFNTWTAVFLGVTPILLGLAAFRARRFSVWTNLSAVAGGVLCLVVGIVNLGLDDQSTLDIPFLVGSLLVTVWVLAAGYEMLRGTQNEYTNNAEPRPVREPPVPKQ
ncbi:MAG: hypothetical protein ABI658_29715 [Acidimicrobiales bacterium]